MSKPKCKSLLFKCYCLAWICLVVELLFTSISVWRFLPSLPIDLPLFLDGNVSHIIFGTMCSLTSLSIVLWFRRTIKKTDVEAHSRCTSKNDLFTEVELFCLILPQRAYREVFEPSFNDCKRRFIETHSKCKTVGQYRWWTFCLWSQTIWLAAQCVWVSMGDKLRRMLTRFLPDIFRRMWGGG